MYQYAHFSTVYTLHTAAIRITFKACSYSNTAVSLALRFQMWSEISRIKGTVAREKLLN